MSQTELPLPGPAFAMSSAQVREELIKAMRLDLVGPSPGHEFSNEILPETPTKWYLTGFLVPEQAPEAHRTDAEADDQADVVGEEGADDGSTPERAPRRSFLPSSMGLNFLLPETARKLDVEISWGDYVETTVGDGGEDPGLGVPGEGDTEPESQEGEHAEAEEDQDGYQRTQRIEKITVPVPEEGLGRVDIPNSRGLRIEISTRRIPPHQSKRLPNNSRAVCVFLINGREAEERHAYRGNIFQAQIGISSPEGFIARPNMRLGGNEDWDEQVADLQYRNDYEFASGTGCAAEAVEKDPSGVCKKIRSTWIPEADVEFTGHLDLAQIPDVELRMEELSKLKNAGDAKKSLIGLVAAYREWIGQQEQKILPEKLTQNRQDTVTELFKRAKKAADRMERGIDLLSHEDVFDAFTTANRAMARQARQRDGQIQKKRTDQVDSPTWRAFQLAFILLNIEGLANPLSADREIVDLLFFPTGGGKTEAYLGLAAFTLVLRRLRNPGRSSGGVSVLMRYTLRLLTLDQLGRASALVCALELERKERIKNGGTTLGDWPFEIGLWVGNAATPNRMGYKGYKGPGKDYTAYVLTNRFKSEPNKNRSPIPLENCPWCGSKFGANSFELLPPGGRPENLHICCENTNCEFSGANSLPIVAVDEPLYRRLPCFVIATVDKFAGMPWLKEAGKLFGKVRHYNAKGYFGYGENIPAGATSLENELPGPDLIIQDELHLISGPLGTIAGLYETAIASLSKRKTTQTAEGKEIVPKIIASTATVRQAESQIRALFGRRTIQVFPPQNHDRKDSFFSNSHSLEKTPGRRYVGVAAQGRSLKVVLLKVSLALLSAAETLYKKLGKDPKNPVDPYMSLLTYYNSLRELGGSRRIIEDEVTARVIKYSRRKRIHPDDKLFSDREISEPLELTSRVSTDKVSEAKHRLSLDHTEKDRVDAALATNMISVGLDITRLGLMVIHGQPKLSAEYIQASSRVGRDKTKPGLVVTMLNVHKPRDRSHYERFSYFHKTFYRSVEVTSVTPFSPRALDRALASTLLSICRHSFSFMAAPRGANEILSRKAILEGAQKELIRRVELHRQMDTHEKNLLEFKVKELCEFLLSTWFNIAQRENGRGNHLQYGKEEENLVSLMHGFLDKELENLPAEYKRFRSNRSMRDIEESVQLLPKEMLI